MLGRGGVEVKCLKRWEQVRGEVGPRAKAGPASLPPLWTKPGASALEVARGDVTACGGAGDDAVSSYNAGIIGKQPPRKHWDITSPISLDDHKETPPTCTETS